MICPFCKESILDGAIKCKHCGSMLSQTPYDTITIDTISFDEIRAFVGTSSPYYIQKFAHFTILGREKFCVTWNWSCCGFTFIWMLYRKMYLFALLTFLAFCIPGLNILLHIGAGMVGNFLYYRHAKTKIIEVRSMQYPQNIDAVLREVGGVNKWITLVGIIIGILMLIFFGAFFTTMFASMGQLTGVRI